MQICPLCAMNIHAEFGVVAVSKIEIPSDFRCELFICTSMKNKNKCVNYGSSVHTILVSIMLNKT